MATVNKEIDHSPIPDLSPIVLFARLKLLHLCATAAQSEKSPLEQQRAEQLLQHEQSTYDQALAFLQTTPELFAPFALKNIFGEAIPEEPQTQIQTYMDYIKDHSQPAE